MHIYAAFSVSLMAALYEFQLCYSYHCSELLRDWCLLCCTALPECYAMQCVNKRGRGRNQIIQYKALGEHSNTLMYRHMFSVICLLTRITNNACIAESCHHIQMHAQKFITPVCSMLTGSICQKPTVFLCCSFIKILLPCKTLYCIDFI